ncbi:M949_RS01915 family surface polysaccharide biosynthesis protein [Novilysobacter avium]|uniref:Lipoprotein n=1 Tax=Novilysobacter avium TaxID=2781023 RepID=A0A7S6ZUR4_9GAMM|nr:hypothetical protein [Lysobacter avium]QOW21539.1 hypothetical protein INQ42_09820 [Lysobacter avium]
MVAISMLLLAGCDGVKRVQSENPMPAVAVAPTPSVQTGKQSLGASELQTLSLVEPVIDTLHFTDRHGDQAVVCSRLAKHAEDPVDGTVADRIVLSAEVYSLPATRAPTAAGWQHTDDIECDGVDIEAGFYPDSVSVTDLDGNGTAELTFAYHRFCGGGIDPRDVTVCLREGGDSYVLEGQTPVRVGNDPPFGAGFQMDAALSAAPQWVQDQVLTTFQQLRDEAAAESHTN